MITTIVRTNIMELLLNELMKGKMVCDNEAKPYLIDSVRFNVKTNTVYCTDLSGETLTFFLDDTIDLITTINIKEMLDVKKIKVVKNKAR